MIVERAQGVTVAITPLRSLRMADSVNESMSETGIYRLVWLHRSKFSLLNPEKPGHISKASIH